MWTPPFLVSPTTADYRPRPLLSPEILEMRRRAELAFAAVTDDDRAGLIGSLELLDDIISAAGPIHDAVLLSHGYDLDAVVENAVWGRRMAVGDDWADMPKWRSWALSAHPHDGLRHLTVRDDESGHPFQHPRLGEIVVHVPPILLPRPALEVYQVLVRDSVNPSLEDLFEAAEAALAV